MDMKTYVCILAVLFCTLVIAEASQDKNCIFAKTFRGCSLSYGRCVCSKERGCVNPFPYKSYKECKNDLKGLNDKCKKEPCLHGACVQAKEGDHRTWHCECAGTGFHGRRCQHKCPVTKIHDVNFPAACAMNDGSEEES